MKKIIVILSLLLIAVPALAAERQRSEDGMRPEMQNAVELDLTTWREEPVPELWSEKWREANQGREYYVFEHNGKLMVSDYRPGSNFEFCFDNGCFSGINKGEFGGELWFQPNGGVKYRILYGNPVAVFVLNGKYYLLEGLAHLDVSRGSLYALEYHGEKLQARKLKDLHAAPRTVLVEGDLAYILVDKYLYKWNDSEGEQGITTIADVESLFALYPHSMVKQGDEFIIGARGVIVTVDEKTGLMRWFIRP